MGIPYPQLLSNLKKGESNNMAGIKVKFKTNKPIMLPVQSKAWGLHEATEMNHDEVFKLLAGGAEDIIAILADGSEIEITWDNLEEYFPRNTTEETGATTLEDHIVVDTEVESSEDFPYGGPASDMDEGFLIPPENNMPDQDMDNEMFVDPEVQPDSGDPILGEDEVTPPTVEEDTPLIEDKPVEVDGAEPPVTEDITAEDVPTDINEAEPPLHEDLPTEEDKPSDAYEVEPPALEDIPVEVEDVEIPAQEGLPTTGVENIIFDENIEL